MTVVRAIYQRWARTTGRGVPVRCNRGRSHTGPILFTTRTAADAAAAGLAAVEGREYVVAPCTRGRHWHVRPVPKEEPVSSPETPSWLLAQDGAHVREAARARVGDDVAVVDADEDHETCPTGCYSCSRAARARDAG